ncbi:hypothetical protein LTR53_008352 [Teratosphaeriaceae sp. CCFEE 6253]|nr:hypothetical protein LTR53_008352 [Teratosphaeriaceae sp. CCFEE 6253]
MPHSTQTSTNTYSERPMTSGSTHHVGNLIGTALTKRPSKPDLVLQQNPNAWKRTSSPVADAYANLVGKGGQNIDEVMEGRLARDRTSLGTYNDASKQRTAYYENQFRYKEGEVGTIRERVQRESPVIAELKTNVIIKDEFTLVTDLSYHLAQRYTRPDSSIMIKVDHSACLALGGTFDPCYILTITTLPSETGPTMNKRNAALIQSFMADILSVNSDRGIIKFQPIEEANYAMDGTTMLGAIERAEKQQDEAGPSVAVRRAINSAGRKSMPSFNKKSMPRLDTEVKAPNGAPMSNGATPVERKRSSTTTATPPPTLSAIPNVFELSATDNERPSTSSGTSTPYAAENGLRMNGISREDLKASKPIGERPRTIAGQSPHGSAREMGKNEAMPRPQRQSSYVSQTQSKRSSLIRDEPLPAPVRKGAIPVSPKPAPRPLTTSAVPASALRYTNSSSSTTTRSTPPPPQAKPTPAPQTTYLDGVSTRPPSAAATAAVKAAGASSRPAPAIDPKIDARAAEKNRAAESRDPAANTAKRRSTVTATPKMPAPPPVPEDTRRRPEPRKRKSFLSAFRRG